MYSSLQLEERKEGWNQVGENWPGVSGPRGGVYRIDVRINDVCCYDDPAILSDA